MKKGAKSFLNNMPEETGYIAWNINNEPEWCKKKTDLEANLTIADCKKSLRLDFNVYEQLTIEDRVKKVERLQQLLEEFKQELIAA
jgi:hypothetical protein